MRQGSPPGGVQTGRKGQGLNPWRGRALRQHVAIFIRDRHSKSLAAYLHRCSSNLRWDGAFMPGWMDRVPVMVGDTWCAHHGRDVSAYPTFSPRRNCYEGVVRVSQTPISLSVGWTTPRHRFHRDAVARNRFRFQIDAWPPTSGCHSQGDSVVAPIDERASALPIGKPRASACPL